MSNDDIMNIAREAGLVFNEDYGTVSAQKRHAERVIRFADRVAATEREACAKVCDFHDSPKAIWSPPRECAASIRSRNQPETAPS